MPIVTAAATHNSLVMKLKRQIELDVEFVTYQEEPGLVWCYLHMRNGFLFEGVSARITGTSAMARDAARKAALEKLITTEQYILAERLYQDAERDNIHRGTT